MMKKIFLLVAFLVFGKMWGYAQYPIQQFIGADSAIVTSKGGLQGRLIPIVITDTNAANAQRMKNYPGAQLYTTSGDFYIRNSNATKWILVSSGSAGGPINIYNSNGVLTGDRSLDGAGRVLYFNTLSKFATQNDTLDIELSGAAPRMFINGLTSDNDTANKPLVIGAGGRIYKTSQWPELTNIYNSDGTLKGNRILTGNNNNLTFTGLKNFNISADSTIITGVASMKNRVQMSGLPTAPGTKSLRIDANGVLSLADTSGGLSGSGTTNYIPKFTSSNAIGNSNIYQSATGSIGIGTNNPLSFPDYTTLAINNSINGALIDFLSNGNSKAQIFSDSTDFYLSTSANVPFIIYTSVSERMRITATGNVGIGTNSPDSMLTVSDGAYFQRGVRMSGLPSTPGVKQLRIDANGVLSAVDTSAGGSGTVTSVATNNGTGITGGTITTTGTLAIDTTVISTRAWRQKGIDSVVALISALPSGTVTSVATNNGTGITGGTITSSGTLAIDTTVISTRAWRQKGVDSLQANINLKLNISDTANMLQNYVNSVGYGLGKTSQTVYADSATLSNYYLRRKDSLTTTNPLGYVTKTVLADTAAAIRGADAGGTVTSVATNTATGITGGTITTSGTLAIDTLLLSTRAWRQKGIDSVAALANTKVGGSGTINYVSKFTGANTIANSIIYDSLGSVGINNTNPSAFGKFSVVGTKSVSGVGDVSAHFGNGTNSSLYISHSGSGAANILTDGSQPLTFGTNGVEAMRIISNGNVLINTTSNAGYKVDINGDLRTAQSAYVATSSGSLGVASVSPDSTLTVNGGVNFNRGVLMSGLPSAPGTKSVRINANGTLSVADTLIDAGGTVTSVATNTATGITGGTITTSGTLAIDTLLISTRAWRQKGVDSVAGLLSGYVPTSRTLTINGTSYDLSANRSWSVGTVTSVATNTGTGITGGTITGSGTIAADTLLLSTRAWRQKGIDSVAALINSNVSGTTNYIPKFTGTNTIGNSVIYESSSNIGIGTTSPVSVSGYTTLTLNNAIAGGNLVFQLNGSDKGSIYNTSSDLVIEVNSGATIFKNGSGEQMRLTSGGSLGIGTSSPSYPVHAYSTSNARIGVQGTTNFSAFQNINSSGSLYWGIDDNAGANFTGVAYGRFIYSSGAYPLSFFTNSTERMRLDASGNLGLGVTPSAWSLAGLNVMQIKNGFIYGYSNETSYGVNAYYNGSSWTYIASAEATRYGQNSGVHAWYNAPSGTAGNAISFTQAMTLDASGRLGLGSTNPQSSMHIETASTNGAAIRMTSTSTNGRTYAVGSNYVLGTGEFAIYDYTAAATRLLINSTGNVGIGTSSPSNLLSISSTANNTSQIDLSGFLGDTKGHIGSYARSFYLSTNWYYNGSQNADNTGYGQAAVELSGSEGAAIFLTSAAGSTVPSERMRITSGGDVGIGTTSPNHLLTINNGASGGTYFGLYQSYVDGNDWRNWVIGTNNQAFGDFNIIQSNATGGNPLSAGTSRLYISKAGNVGIGTTSPGGILEARAGTGANLRVTTNGSNNLLLQNYNDADGYRNFLIAASTVQLFTGTEGGTNASEKMRITSGGDVGIGTTSPSATLHVNGTIKTASPSGGTAKPFKIGAAAVVSPTSPNRTIEIEIDGVTYYLSAKTTND